MLKLSSVPCGAAGGCDTSPGVCARLRVGPAGLLAVLSGSSCTAVTSGFCESECDCCSSSHPEGVKPADSSLSESAVSHCLWGSLPLPAGSRCVLYKCMRGVVVPLGACTGHCLCCGCSHPAHPGQHGAVALVLHSPRGKCQLFIQSSLGLIGAFVQLCETWTLISYWEKLSDQFL